MVRSFPTCRVVRVLAVMVWLVTFGVSVDAQEDIIWLFDGKSLDAWTFYLQDPNAKLEDVWTIRDGVLVCRGRPVGYLRTKEEFSDYELRLEWRWPKGSSGGNSGVLVHCTTPNALGVWPKSIEVQLASGNAGDFWVIGTEISIPDVEKRRMGRRHLNLTDGSEKPIGQWNEMVVICRGDTIKVYVNGDLVNECSKASQTKGAIALQSEGAEIQFRNIRLKKL
ncbi:MAG: hypothetical protein KatS3mg110_3745 [Pirellulaceae bacterium]|nr:MAG: hypothetical protein KatS3mg110_3737 [Pirellulaceae bacterium]GIW95704.1 MAG: hypothetical protein KatS3mg110_3745 [Pirellulaceae bacterium]